MSIPYVVLVLALLLVVIALAEPLARKLLLPTSVVLALFGSGIGLAASFALFGGGVAADHPLVLFFADPPLPSAVFIYVFLPTLLFQSALGMSVSEMADDAVPILMLAVIAVVTATIAIGVALWPAAGVGLVACLLVGAIVATTDPVAVIGIFRAVGAPERLVRLVEGESLLNDAAAITMFVVFTALITRPADVSGLAVLVDFLVIPFGGGLVGWIAASIFVRLIGMVGDNRTVQISLSLALPYLAYVVSEQLFHLSGVIAVVAAGLTLAREGPARMTPDAWRYLRDVWSQLDYWAATLLFVLASILVPRLLAGATGFDLVLLALLVAAATAARGFIVYLVLPLLARLKLSTAVSRPYRAVIFWGGLRGATTLALALAVTEDRAMPADVARLVAVLATGFTLFTLLVQGTTLRPLMKALALDRLSPVDEVVRDEAIAVAYERVAESLADNTRRYRLSPKAVAKETEAFRARSRLAALSARARTGLTHEDRVALALVALARREQELILHHAGAGVFPPFLTGPLLADARALMDGARLRGEEGWRAAAERSLGFDWQDRLANAAQHRLGLEAPLARRLEDRFQRLLCTGVLLRELDDFAAAEILPVAGPEPGAAIGNALSRRAEAVDRAIKALRLQYPDYADEVEAAFVHGIGHALEDIEVRALAGNGLINAEVERDLVRDLEARRSIASSRHRLDLGLDAGALFSASPLFASLDETEKADLARRLRPVFAYPGQVLMRRGERGDAAWFISSGAVEVDTGRAAFLLGRGDVVGEMSLVTGRPRSGTVTAAGYCSLFRLATADFETVMTRRPELRREIERIAFDRERATVEPGG